MSLLFIVMYLIAVATIFNKGLSRTSKGKFHSTDSQEKKSFDIK